MTTSTQLENLERLLEDPIFDAIDLSRNSDLPDRVIVRAQTQRAMRLAIEFASLQLREAAKTYRELADESLSAEADAIVRGLDARANALFSVPSQPAGSGSHSGHASP